MWCSANIFLCILFEERVYCEVESPERDSQLFCTIDLFYYRKLIEAEYLRASDLKPGMKVSCVIREHKQKGAIVDIKAGGGKITGFVRSEHMGNVPLANPEKKFPVGSTHPAKVRIWI